MQTKKLTSFTICITNASEVVENKAKPLMKKNKKTDKKPRKKYPLIAFRPSKEVREMLPEDPDNLSKLINEALQRKLPEVIEELERERIARLKLSGRIAPQDGDKDKG